MPIQLRPSPPSGQPLRSAAASDGYFECEALDKTKLPWLYEVDSGELFALAGLGTMMRSAYLRPEVKFGLPPFRETIRLLRV